MKSMKSINKNSLFVIVVLIVAVGVGMWRSHRLEGPQQAGLLMSHPKALPSFELTEALSNKSFTSTSLLHQWSFLFFGYTSCPDICPKTIQNLNQVSQILHFQHQIQYLFISINPEKDTPQALASYFSQERFQPSPVKALTGDKKQIMELAKTIGIFVDEHPSQPELSGPIEHSGTIVLLNPKGELAAVFMPSDTPAEIAQGFQKIYQQNASLHRVKPALPA